MSSKFWRLILLIAILTYILLAAFSLNYGYELPAIAAAIGIVNLLALLWVVRKLERMMRRAREHVRYDQPGSNLR